VVAADDADQQGRASGLSRGLGGLDMEYGVVAVVAVGDYGSADTAVRGAQFYLLGTD
jgi:hypothetical protein